MQNQPEWKNLVVVDSSWNWRGAVLVEDGASTDFSSDNGPTSWFASLIVSNIYGRQNKVKAVRQVVASALARLNAERVGLNFGSGRLRYATNVLNLDLSPGQHVDVVSAGSLTLPFKDNSLHLIICQEVLEHVDRPFAAIAEFHRVLDDKGELVLQLPFIIGYHPGPTDFWRFSTEAYAVLLPRDKWEILEKHITVGHGSALHRIATEFVAVHFSPLGGRVYRLAKGLTALLLFPLVLFDVLLPYLPEKDRVAGGYIVRARPVKS